MDRKGHLAVDKLLFGKEYEDVHKWLDGTFWKYSNSGNPYKHWLNHHHMEAINAKYGMINGTKHAVAVMHVIVDMVTHFQIPFIPKDAKDLKKFLKTIGYGFI